MKTSKETLGSIENAPELTPSTLKDDLARHYFYTLGRDKVGQCKTNLYHALALTIKDRLIDGWRSSRNKVDSPKTRRVAYLSLEFLMGRSLNNAILNLDLDESVREALLAHATELEDVEEAEHDAGLGNGGLGRLAACFLDSCANLSLPVTGYGIRYEYGMFNQQIDNGHQIEHPDHWLREENVWEIRSAESSRRVKFFGHVTSFVDKAGKTHYQWVNTQDVLAVPYDMPVPGRKNNTVNTLRLWKSEATDEFDLSEFNAGSYTDAVAAKNSAEQISMVLYPNDASENGKELRLRQQYFLSSASLQDIIADWVASHGEDFTDFAEYHVFQLNDTHPSIAVAELMRILLDDHDMEWDAAWDIVTRSMAYTNHTLLPEALEKWSVPLFQNLLPRLLDIIYEINARFLVQVAAKWPGDTQKLRDMSIIEEGDVPHVRMAYLAIVGSFSVNGVAALHSRLLIDGLFKEFAALSPEKFNNKTNGVTPRRWLAHCNRPLNQVISEYIGDEWENNFSLISQLAKHAEDASLHKAWKAAKLENKRALVKLIKERCHVDIDPQMMFDVQVKRIHEYKRQLLNILHVIHLYQRIRSGNVDGIVPRCVIIGGKAAPGYFMAKLIIKLINNVAAVVNNDPVVSQYLKVVFFPNYNVTAMESICPATDLSEQVSTAGKEASGTGNMKFMMNGALTIGTLDGANVEIREMVGEENFFLFGARTEQIQDVLSNYEPDKIISASTEFSAVMTLLESGHFNVCEPNIFQPIIDSIRSASDHWLVAHDFADYVRCQQEVEACYKDTKRWTKMSILNTASSGAFSSDRTIGQYAKDIWNIE